MYVNSLRLRIPPLLVCVWFNVRYRNSRVSLLISQRSLYWLQWSTHWGPVRASSWLSLFILILSGGQIQDGDKKLVLVEEGTFSTKTESKGQVRFSGTRKLVLVWFSPSRGLSSWSVIRGTSLVYVQWWCEFTSGSAGMTRSRSRRVPGRTWTESLRGTWNTVWDPEMDI